MIRTIKLRENPVIGVFATCTEDVALVPIGTQPKVCDTIEELLDVRVIKTLVASSSILGSLSRGNSKGFLIPDNSSIHNPDEIGVPIESLPGNYTAVGNVILANDNAALVHPELPERAVEVISNTLGVDVHKGTIAGIKTVGMAGVVTNKGVLVHPRATPDEIGKLEEIFGLSVDIGTINYGSQMVGSGLLANSKGYVAGSDTTGHELGRVEDVLGFI
jgi:translation initiation factor 6